MKKIIALLILFVAFTVLFSGCAKPKGTFGCDNYTELSMSVSWCGYDMSVGPYDYTEYIVNAGGGTASVYASGYGQWGSIYIDVPEGGYNGVEMYWDKSKSTGNPGLKTKPVKGKTAKNN